MGLPHSSVKVNLSRCCHDNRVYLPVSYFFNFITLIIMDPPEIIINSVLCFINSASGDYSNSSLQEVIYSFYSHEEIKVAKELLCNILKKDLIWRRDPDKKRKDLKDLLEFYDEFKTSKIKVKLVTNSHKKMPPVGLELFAPILTNLAEEINKINDVLPKILDIKSEVVNTADTVRQMKIDVSDLRNKFSNAINGMEEVVRDCADAECSVIEELSSFRQVDDNVGQPSDHRRRSSVGVGPGSYARAVVEGERSVAAAQDEGQAEVGTGNPPGLVANPVTGGISKSFRMPRRDSESSRTSGRGGTSNLRIRREQQQPRLDEHEQPDEGDDWIQVQRNKKKQRENAMVRKESAKILGSKKTCGHSFKAATKSVDVFIGRVHKDVSMDKISEYIKDTFNVNVVSILQLDIKSDRVNAFKVTVNLSEREKLFNGELWPEDIVVNKFYNKSFNKGKAIKPSILA